MWRTKVYSVYFKYASSDCNTKWDSGFHKFKGYNYSIQYVKQSISGCLSHCGITNKQTDQSKLLYSMTFWYSLHLICQFGFSSFHDGTNNLISTVLQHLNTLTSIRMELQNLQSTCCNIYLHCNAYVWTNLSLLVHG